MYSLTKVSPGTHGEGFPCGVEEVDGASLAPVTTSNQAVKKRQQQWYFLHRVGL